MIAGMKIISTSLKPCPLKIAIEIRDNARLYWRAAIRLEQACPNLRTVPFNAAATFENPGSFAPVSSFM
jgi:hypothetical protein